MKSSSARTALLGFALLLTGCQHTQRNFSQDVAFLARHVDTIVLADGEARVAVVPAYQGRVMTSTAGGDSGTSYGFIKYDQVAAGFTHPRINVFGGEDRFWLGPEGGQFSLFFAPGAAFDFASWATPAVIDTEPYEVVDRSDTTVRFRHVAAIGNYAGADFHLAIEREVALLTPAQAARLLDLSLDGLAAVAYESRNRLTNAGDNAWTRDTGLLSIWILGMYKPGPQTTIVIPFHRGGPEQRGPFVNDAYFGKVPPERLVIGDGVLFFSGDGRQRGKIGLGPRRATPVAGSWDAARGVLTIVQYNQPGPEVIDYVNSMWELQDEPFAGDVINSYNDGPPEPGAEPLGPFYELETSSPALALAPGQTAEHIHRTLHLEGPRARLDAVARATLGVSLDQIEAALP